MTPLALPLLQKLLATALSASKSETARDVGSALGGLDLRKDKAAVRRFKLAVANREFDSDDLREINETIREEVRSGDPYVARWRPTFGYGVAASFVALVAAGVGAVFFKPDALPLLIDFVTASSGIWQFALAVLGVGVWRRSDDKARAAGAPTFLEALTRRR